jgi:hypothetical protein
MSLGLGLAFTAFDGLIRLRDISQFASFPGLDKTNATKCTYQGAGGQTKAAFTQQQ